ncbi:nucleolus and neural progenitor protein-like, partial [Anneissia japonica]|uniref:nucleolus and neural progenitor protein-like n=1 Tax=Anneissia japonica TaxID=1529436 RepID=UPI00142570F3
MAAPIEFRWNTFTEEYPTQTVLTVWKKKPKLTDEGAKKIELMTMFSEASMFLEPVFKTYLSAELDTLQKFLYKLKNQQRNWKWFNLLQKIHKTLKRANDIKLHEFFKKMSSVCAIKDDLSDMEKLPNCKTIKVLLEKTVGLSKLCTCILEDSEYTFTLIVGHVQVGQFLSQNLIFVAIISRIWVLVRGTLIKLFSWYKLLRKLSVQDKQSKYYKMFKELPKCLSEWVEVDVACLKTRNKKIKKKLKPDTLDKMFGSSPTSSDTLENLRNLESSNKEDLYDSMAACSEIDLGEPIVTADNGSINPKKKKKRKKKHLLHEDVDNLVMVNKNKDDFDPIQESYEEEVSLEDHTGVAVSKKKKKKKRKHVVDDGIGSQLCDSLPFQERLKARICAEHEELPVKVNKIIDDEES